MQIRIVLLVCMALTTVVGHAQEQQVSGIKKLSDEQIAKLIASYKTDIRGPYRDIRWFCKDGSTLPPQERCPEPGVQRARYRDEVLRLAQSNHIYLGQILATTDLEAFWDSSEGHSQLKQYQLEQFLRANDNGWINRRAQFYRGAYQIEDEEAWGISFLSWVLEERTRTRDNFFLIRQAAKDIPHAAENNVALNVRALSKEIADSLPAFMDLRVKIHGQPDAGDIGKVMQFRTANRSRLSAGVDAKFGLLISDMEALYKPTDISDFAKYLKKIPATSDAHKTIKDFIDAYPTRAVASERSRLITETSLAIRQQIANPMKSSGRLSLIDVSNKLETLLSQESSKWKPAMLKDQMDKVYTLAKAAAGFGYLELWEWEELEQELMVPDAEKLSLANLSEYSENARRSVEWGAGMVRATYQDVIKLYAGFEPLANGIVDDKVRASILLNLGASVSILGDFFSKQAGFSNSLMGIPNQSAARGLNPGYAQGELVVTNLSPEEIEVSADKIYVFNRPPADLKPVAGIATVTEGNMVSHVQLLARNLGIPNAVVSADNLQDLLPFSGRKVFYAVSNRGTVLLKPVEEMIPLEKELFAKKVRSEEKISVPVEEMELTDARILNLREVNASNSGSICGPKAANLGQLKQMYPDNVVEGLVIPFAVFKSHFDQQMPGKKVSYWEYLTSVFETAEQMRNESESEQEIEKYVLDELGVLRSDIKKIPLQASFETQLKETFRKVFGKPMGSVPVFIRSDTNMEDLKDFTGAGLNLTLFNVLDANLILQGIKDVWASPYTERSYKWRQTYLLNPENVFPSILIIPSVNADCSGVLITKGVSSGNPQENTVAFNRGVGGAVEGQASESWLLKEDGSNLLLFPAREPEFTKIPASGGTAKALTGFEDRILTASRLSKLQQMASSLRQDLSELGINGPYDVELGFQGDKIWLFQVRPFVENKRAAASEYLRTITPTLDADKAIPLNSKL